MDNGWIELYLSRVCFFLCEQGERQAEDVEEITDPDTLRRIFQVLWSVVSKNVALHNNAMKTDRQSVPPFYYFFHAA